MGGPGESHVACDARVHTKRCDPATGEPPRVTHPALPCTSEFQRKRLENKALFRKNGWVTIKIQAEL
jgi:hypothetical protein